MHTLKVQLGLTLSVLLFISMFLFGLVLLVLWQRSVVNQETIATARLLQMASSSLLSATPSSGVKIFPPETNQLFEDSAILCLQWQSNDSDTIQSHGNCPTEPSLTPLLHEAARGGNTTSYSGMIWNGFFFTKQFLLMATPLQQVETTHGAIGLIRSLEKSVTPIHEAQNIFFAYLVINVLIFSTIGFTRLVHLVIRPIQHLARLADSRTDQDDTSFFTGERWGEFTQLSLSLNRLVSRIDGDKQELRSTVQSLKAANDELQKNRDEMIRAEKLASIGRLSAGLAHEIGNPLGIVQGYIDLLADDTLDGEERKLFSQKALHELSRINSLIRNLLDLSRTPTASTVATVEVHVLLKDIMDAVRIRKTAVEITYATDLLAANSHITIDSDGLRQVLLNCILNSIDAIEERTDNEKGDINLTTANSVSEEKTDLVQITLQDNGTGISVEHLKTIFDPFFTTKEVGKGTGLGLAVAHNFIKKSGGSLHVSSTLGQGTTVTITLPLASQPINPKKQEKEA
jgi:two-component system, NtrC family, sensor kinase